MIFFFTYNSLKKCACFCVKYRIQLINSEFSKTFKKYSIRVNLFKRFLKKIIFITEWKL